MWNFVAAADYGATLVVEESGVRMDWSSFWPDMIVAGLTTGGIALLVLTAEQRISRRRHRQETSNAQHQVVEAARSVLASPLVFKKNARPSLVPAERHFTRLSDEVSRVPNGAPLDHVVGYYWVANAVGAAEQLRFQADALIERFTEYERMVDGRTTIPQEMVTNVTMFAHMPNLTHPLPWNLAVIPRHVRVTLDADEELTTEVLAYLHQRRLLEAYREAFLQADGEWRAEAWVATVNMAKGAPHNLIKAKYRTWKMNRQIEAAGMKAESNAQDIVTAVDPMG
ncbi:hypothetical protein [Microbacterium maritypicum]|uniref:hypothetical protein n=1 Tax=Microbacterium maritypicum TaxID=33918 RepID=UPI0038161443